ncbi:hypothetical protein EVJ58_g6983 [Rhodofomes roseus]|uniref:Integrase catalytic domain-containing protein n=1 Tax=Rhodofomes roseus TaxID=34475 RepID=A0A4Y9Y7G0_9APHY|nr:hypothetical protein EVJ58_g6983 [Rhodofomes roseus]
MADDKEKVLILPENFHLTRSNWIQWKSKILTIAELKGVLEHLDGTTSAPIPVADTPTPTEAKAIAKWRKDDLLAKATCTLNMDIESCGIEPHGKTAHEFWSALLAVKERRSELAIQNADEYLRACKYVPGDDIHAHIEELRRRRKACREIGSPLTNARFAIVICQSMGNTYEHITAPLLTRTDPEEVILTILAVHDNAMLQSGRPQNPLGDTLTTTIAGQKTSAFMTAAKAAMICDWCMWKGHTKERCYCEGGGMAGQQPAHWKSQPRPKKGSPADLAHPGGNTTPAANTAASAASPPQVSLPSAAAASAGSSTYNYDVFHNVLLASAAPADQATPNGTIRAYLDSGASHHYFTDRAYFSEYLPLKPHTGSSAKRGADFTIIGVGCVHAEMLIEGRRSIVTFRNALHVPDLAANLISLSRIDGNGGEIQIRSGEMRIVGSGGGEPMLVGKLTANNLYEVVLTRLERDAVPAGSITSGGASAFASLTNAKATDVHTWHRRFGHASERTVIEMAKSGVVTGMQLVGGMPRGKCEDCIKGKHPRAPFTSSNVEEEVLERVYIDLTGRAREPSMGGAYHGMTIHDGASSYEECELLRTKEASETLEAFKAYHARAELQTGKKLRRIRTDNGPEFENALWESYTREHGIVHELTTPYTPQQDGVAERGHRTLGDHARAMLFDAGLPVGLWGEAYRTATYVKNLTASARQKGHTPYISRSPILLTAADRC